MEVTNQMCKDFNSLRQDGQNINYSHKELAVILGQVFDRKPSTMITDYIPKLVSVGALERGPQKSYRFTKEPVYIEKLQNAMRFSRFRGKRAQEKTLRTVEISFKEALARVKQEGYKVMKPIMGEVSLEKILENPNRPIGEFLTYEEI